MYGMGLLTLSFSVRCADGCKEYAEYVAKECSDIDIRVESAARLLDGLKDDGVHKAVTRILGVPSYKYALFPDRQQCASHGQTQNLLAALHDSKGLRLTVFMEFNSVYYQSHVQHVRSRCNRSLDLSTMVLA
jgi:hypothetical protein